jgi:hypothetical protein
MAREGGHNAAAGGGGGGAGMMAAGGAASRGLSPGEPLYVALHEQGWRQQVSV